MNIPPMKVINYTHTPRSIMGTSLQGYLEGPIEEIIDVLGGPNEEPSGDLKVEWEWIYKLNNEIVTIYNYKTGPLYLKKKEITINDIERWHIGGKSSKAVKLLQKLFVYEHKKTECRIYED